MKCLFTPDLDDDGAQVINGAFLLSYLSWGELISSYVDSASSNKFGNQRQNHGPNILTPLDVTEHERSLYCSAASDLR
jgi:hypothetical protein